MNPAEMCDAELSDSIAREVYGMQFSERYGFWMNADGSGGMSPLTWSPATDDAQALAAFDRAAELVGAKDKKISWTHYTDALDPISYAVIHWGYGPYAEALAATRPRALSECAVAAVRSWREMRGAT